ncbi:MAG: chemotaxis protein CheW [Geopsychrobacter sp.]|nr:chemotaxis protein CheW [Geopsychrobacter sp.]
MSDMRQKLLPVFLQEAKRKIGQLDDFFAAVSGEDCSLEELETAFRAAHTLKGTAALVQAEAVRVLSGRIEGILEGHFENYRFPSSVECEAMQLALERLKLLIDAVAKNLDEPVALLIEAELALKLATAMPGRRPLAELLAATTSVDPFAEDPELDLEIKSSEAERGLAEPEDPFAEDDAYNLGPAKVGVLADPFADDPGLDLSEVAPELQPISFAELDDTVTADLLGGKIPVDPFMKDTEFCPETLKPAVAAEKTAPSFIERMRQRIEKESVLQTAKRLSETLARQDEGEIVARNYSCCRFRAGEKDYYLPITNMLEIADLPNIMRLPLASPIVIGLINLRGQVLPVIDLGIQSRTTSSYVAVRKLVIAEAAGEKLAFLSDGIPDLSEEVQGQKVDVANFIDQFRVGAT